VRAPATFKKVMVLLLLLKASEKLPLASALGTKMSEIAKMKSALSGFFMGPPWFLSERVFAGLSAKDVKAS
jgi:hypothetical protein